MGFDLPNWIVALLALVGSGAGAYGGMKAALAAMTERVMRLETDVGTHDTGIRKWLHDLSGTVGHHELRLEVLERKQHDSRLQR